ncbi:MAG: hypothetical protein HZB42_06340 [Sphingobacteriales bacterium]|nr:hypothetical protein [Sphingobacteriales bacterium]
MTRFILLLSIGLLFIPFGKTVAQTSSISLSYFKAERSKDSYSIGELFSLEGKNLSYAIKKTGRAKGGPYPNNNDKTCLLSDEEVSQIWKIITDKQLNKQDSLVNNSPLNEPYTSESIDITVMKNGKVTSISIKAESSWLSDKPLYKNAGFLIAAVRDILARRR